MDCYQKGLSKTWRFFDYDWHQFCKDKYGAFSQVATFKLKKLK